MQLINFKLMLLEVSFIIMMNIGATFALIFQTRYIAIVPTSFYDRPTLRVELFGCRTEIANLHVTTVTENITVSYLTGFRLSQIRPTVIIYND